MLSYRHAYHAGNFADVFKHVVLVRVLTHLKQKNKPICYVDTHAGGGIYHLSSKESQKNQEYQSGIGNIWKRDDSPAALVDYLGIIRHFNPTGQLSQYPGSPLIASRLLGRNDRRFLYELHGAESKSLNDALKTDRYSKIFRADGLKDSLGLLPPQEHRGVILIDPSYELKTDYQAVTDALTAMHKRFATGCYLLWYPVVDRKRNRFLERNLSASGIKNIQLYEFGVQPDSEGFGMTACGMIAINPPWTLLQDMQETLPWLVETLAESHQGNYRIEQLVAE